MNTITDLVVLSYENAKAKGFHDPENNPDANSVPTKLALASGELVGEALEEWRRPDRGAETRYRESDGKPEGLMIELADAMIRIADTAGYLVEQGLSDIDLESAIREKMAFNSTRPHMHGKRL
jgi:hypothetical protein